MKSLLSMNRRWWLVALLLVTLSLTGCSDGLKGSDGAAGTAGTPGTQGDTGIPGPVGPTSSSTNTTITTTVTVTADSAFASAFSLVQGNVVGDAAAGLTGAPLPGGDPVPGAPATVPLTGPVSVVLVNEGGIEVANTTVTAANGNFVLLAPKGHSYMTLLRNGSPTGTNIGPLMVDSQTGRVAFSLPYESSDVNFGSVTIDSQLGKAWCGTNPGLAPTTAAFPLDQIAWLGTSDIPTDAPASPLFGAQPYTQQLLLFEEFGPETMPTGTAVGWTALPQPQSPQSGPDPTALEGFLAQAGVSPYPTEQAYVYDPNPWKGAIETFLGPLSAATDTNGNPVPGLVAPAEGRPSGPDWAHQSWADFVPQKFFKTTVAPARTNLGFRNGKQRHGYAVGEFGPGGLYNTVFPGLPAGTTAGVAIKMHPNMPVQDPNSVWTFDGTLPPKLLQGRYGVPVLMRNYNSLPMDITANHPAAVDTTMISNGFGRHTITTHEHNGHQPAESDGFAGAFFFPGQFYDYHWPIQLAGYSNNNNAQTGAINPGATEPKAATPCEAGESFPIIVNGVVETRTCTNGTIMIPGDWYETMSTHWFHDHMLDHTAENVYKGNATMMNYYSALDRGNEAINDGVNLRLPSGTALNWGNRDYDVNLVVADKATDQNGQLWFNTVQHDGFCGDMMTVNWQYKPYLDVRARRYRFRILNGSVSRIMAIGLVKQVNGTGGELPGPAGSGISYNRIPLHMIANDGNILQHAVAFDGRDQRIGNAADWKGQLPSQTIAERYDIIVDFSKYGIVPGDKLYFVNILEHQDGKGTKSKVPIADILSERYHPVVQNGHWINGDPGVGKFMELRVQAYAGTDLSLNPVDYEPGKLTMLPIRLDRATATVNGLPLANATHHTMEFVRSQAEGGHGTPWAIKVDGGADDRMDPHRISSITHGDLEVWTIKGGGGWTHPVHIHFEEGMILTRMGKYPPDWELYGKKDMYRIGPENDSGGIIEIAYRARDFLGDYVMHCHNTMHEDHAMLLRWDARNKGAALVDTPMPTYGGVGFEPSFALPLADGAAGGGDGIGPKKGVPTQ